jgi:Fur family ferric uptake transcriptional regulator
VASSPRRPTDDPPSRPHAGGRDGRARPGQGQDGQAHPSAGHDTAGHDAAGQGDLSDRLRAGGYRITPARQLVLNAVAELDHATPDTICAEVQRTASSVNLSTVYRTLELLEELELVSHTHLGHGAPIYHAAHERDHLHLVCRTCGRVEEAPAALADPLVERLRRESGFAVDVAHFAIYGQCAQCRAAAAQSESAESGSAQHESAQSGSAQPGSAQHGEDCGPHRS